MTLIENPFYRYKPIYESDLKGRFVIPKEMFTETIQILKAFGENEGLVFWAGNKLADGSVEFKSVVTADVDSRPQGVFITDTEFGRVSRRTIKTGQCILAQVHSHPGECTIHSDGDDDLIVIQFEGMLSLVVPNYGNEVVDFSEVTIHQWQAGSWTVASNSSIEELVELTGGYHG